MVYQVDQSGKIEQTSKDTVLGYANEHTKALRIPRRLKRKIQEIFRLHGFSSLFIYYLFSVGIFYLIKEFKNKEEIIVDTEYPGKDKLISSFISNFLEKFKKPAHNVSFARIGTNPPAHYAAKDVFDKKKIPDRILAFKDIIEALKKTDGRLRECLSTLVDAQTRSMSKHYHIKQKKSRSKKKHG